MPSNHVILAHPLLLLPSIFPSIRIFSNKLALCIKWPKYWSFSFTISPSSEYSGLISFRMDWLNILAVQGRLKSLLQNHSLKASVLQCSVFLRYINQGKLEVVKQEMTRVNTDMLAISKLKWIGMGEFNSDDHYIYYCGKESLRRNGITIIINKRVQNAVLGCTLKNDRMISVHFQGKPFSMTIIQVYASTINAKEAEVDWFYEDLQDLLELIPKNDVHFIIGDWNAKVGSQEIPGVTGNFGLLIQNDTGQRLTESSHLNVQIEIHLQRLFYCIR